MYTRSFFLFMLFAAILITSCNSKKAQSVSVQQAALAEPFQMVYSEGGGITGQIDSYQINSNGLVEHFRTQPGKDDSLMWSKHVSINELAELQQSVGDQGRVDFRVIHRVDGYDVDLLRTSQRADR